MVAIRRRTLPFLQRILLYNGRLMSHQGVFNTFTITVIDETPYLYHKDTVLLSCSVECTAALFVALKRAILRRLRTVFESYIPFYRWCFSTWVKL